MRMQWLMVGVLGLGLTACATSKAAKESAEAKEAPETKLTMDKVPAAVKETIAKEAPGVTVTSVDMSSVEGKNVYEADAMIGGKNYEIQVAEDGSLILKKLDMETPKPAAAAAAAPAEKKD